MDEIKKDERKQKELKKLDKYWKKIFIDKKGFTNNIQQFFKQIALINKKQYTLKIIKEFFDRRKLVKDDIFDKKDPFVVMGIFYPIHLMLKYGKIDKMMLTGENPKK